MEDDELYVIMVRLLFIGCCLMVLFDFCYFGIVFDLLYVYLILGNIKELNVVVGVGKGLMGVVMDYVCGDVMGMVKGLFFMFIMVKNINSVEEIIR